MLSKKLALLLAFLGRELGVSRWLQAMGSKHSLACRRCCGWQLLDCVQVLTVVVMAAMFLGFLQLDPTRHWNLTNVRFGQVVLIVLLADTGFTVVEPWVLATMHVPTPAIVNALPFLMWLTWRRVSARCTLHVQVALLGRVVGSIIHVVL